MPDKLLAGSCLRTWLSTLSAKEGVIPIDVATVWTTVSLSKISIWKFWSYKSSFFPQVCLVMARSLKSKPTIPTSKLSRFIFEQCLVLDSGWQFSIYMSNDWNVYISDAETVMIVLNLFKAEILTDRPWPLPTLHVGLQLFNAFHGGLDAKRHETQTWSWLPHVTGVDVDSERKISNIISFQFLSIFIALSQLR